ncbi:MAG TPA: DsbA family protein [Bryobacteraceae bacterium]|jgi:protein-disulfide isomerase
MHQTFFLRATVACLTLVFSAAAQQPSPEAPAPSTEKAAIEQIVRQYILLHPEVLVESMRVYQERERAEQQKRSRETVLAHLNDLQHDPSSPVTGAGPGLTIVEFFDYHCGFCKRAEGIIQKVLADHPDVHFVFKEFPFLGTESALAAKASLAADKQGGYLKFHQALMALSGSISLSAIEDLAARQGLDVSRLKKDIESPEIKAALLKNRELGRDLGVKSTPSFVIGSELVQGVIDAAAFDRLISEAQTRGSHAELSSRAHH